MPPALVAIGAKFAKSLHLYACCRYQISKTHLLLLDRTNSHIEDPRVGCEELSSNRVGETGKSIRQQLLAARNIQHTRFTNSNPPNTEVILSRKVCPEGEIPIICHKFLLFLSGFQ
jgi:predicted ATPase with chaperone activity